MMTAAIKPKDILVVGGGTAGWMSAILLANRWPDVNITLLESAEIGIVGVGEGSTPHMRAFFDEVGIAESQWMPRCNATYKNGIRFAGWSEKPGFESYFHPFPAQTDDIFTLPVFFERVQQRLQGVNLDAHPDAYFLESYLAHHNLGPIAAETFPFGVAYGYHFDALLLGKFLAEQAKARGVSQVLGTLDRVLLNDHGVISAVQLETGEILSADFFIDCTGFHGRLLQNALKVPFNDFSDNLFNNAAVTLPTEIDAIIPPQTRATALSAGWAWNIPLTNRYGNGYVYSQNYLSADQAEFELRQHLGLLDTDVNARHLTMRVGRVEHHWYKNCLAVGLSQGFIEPLEATALALAYETISRFIQYYEKGGFNEQYRAEFNRDINRKFEGVRDYIVCHYKANQRNDTEYWRDNAANSHISESLQQILWLWHNSRDFVRDMHARNLVVSYQPKSWACLLAGYGVFPSPSIHPVQPASMHIDFIRRCGLNFPSHNHLLD